MAGCTGLPKVNQLITGCKRVPMLGRSLLFCEMILLFHDLELVEQGLITDFEDLGGLPAIPTGLCQDALDGLLLRLHGGATPDL